MKPLAQIRRQFRTGVRKPRSCAVRSLLALCALSPSAFSQTWAGGETTPSVLDIAAVDETGEMGWVFGAEDLAGDGLDTFAQQEQSIDVRTAYATADADLFWVRAYVSNDGAPGGNMSLYVFVDEDQSRATGGSAIAPEIDPRFDTDPTSGGYDYVVSVGGNEMIMGVYEFDAAQGEFINLADPETLAVPEVGVDLDPIIIGGGDHGYLQVGVDLSAIGLTMSCDAGLFIRSLNDTGSLGTGDLEVGGRTTCGPQDENDNRIPDTVEPILECSSDSQCPGDGICIDGSCVIPFFCRSDADCDGDDECDPDGVCRAAPPGDEACSDNSDCDGLICSTDGVCESCTADSQCDDGFRCGPAGYCVDGSDATDPTGGDGDGDTTSGDPEDVLEPGDEIQGGAFKCSTSFGSADSRRGVYALLLLMVAMISRSVARRREQL